MAYIYPKFSNNEFLGVRFGGAGLGNLLFTWANAEIIAKENNLKVIWPTWKSIKVGPWIRNEKDKRFYGDLFDNKDGHIGGIKKFKLLRCRKPIHYKNVSSYNDLEENDVIIYDEYRADFSDLIKYRDYLVKIFKSNLQKKGEKAMAFDASNSVNIHVRMGDFANNQTSLDCGQNNTRIPIEWYVWIVKKLRECLGNININVFSDGSREELAPLLSLDGVTQVTFGNSIADIVALSKSPLVISSGSTFSLWARFIGNCNSISYPKQNKARTVSDEGFELEIGMGENFSEEEILKIKRLYNYI